ncbi:MAG: UDP-4-amino-4,6-dideoxy-N-acetyl-beta-L-altrosamine transaminase [Dehalococcoidia bacterium]|nr:UDP-4-amino-4,6-dideoxy-N-acetyl-beta-L-altrosamine transaminase [Dehalococcoidia bacterium]|tara:strand:+ start:3204 stop:4373 length:1170 start_codon:yes stop_codon:yes gene_type:complete
MRDKKSYSFYGKSTKVPFFVPFIDKSDILEMKKTLDSTVLTNGPKLKQFETAFRKITKAKFAIGVSNATAALHLSLNAIGIKRGDEVLVPNLTFAASANSIILAGGTPVIVDVDETMNISSNSIKKAITKKTKAIMPVHFAGLSCQMDEIKDIAKANSLKIIEDCAHAIGTKFKSKHVGTIGDAGCFSFYPTKNISTIEGGMMITNDRKIAKSVELARNHGITRTLMNRYSEGKPWEYDIREPGYNYRLDEVRATLGISQLKKLDMLNQKRKNAFVYYNKFLSGINGLSTPAGLDFKDHSCHLYIIRISKNAKINRDKLYESLLKKGIITSVHYKPLDTFTVFKEKAKVRGKLVRSKELFKEILSLPLYPNITKAEQDFVIKVIRQNLV